MINPADFLKWCAVFNIPTGGGAPGSVTEQQVQQFAFNYAPGTGVDDAFIVNLSPPVAALTNGLMVSMTSGSLQNLTADPTLQVDSQTPVAITLWGGLSVAPGDIMPNSAYLFIYDLADNNFQLLNPSISTASTFLVQSNFYNTAVDSGTSNAYAVTLVPEPQGSFGIGFPIYMQAGGGSTNTGASTLSVNGTVNDIVLWNGNALPAGSIRANGTYWLMWSSSLGKWVLMNPVPQQTIVTLADETSTLPDSFSLGTLMNGLLKISVTDSVAAIMNAVNGTDYWAPGDVITLPGSPTNSLDAATKGYVDSVAAGLNPTAAVEGASTANLTGFTYNNGSSGIGATLTAPAVGAFIEDGITYTTGQRFLYKNDTTGSGAYNGIYDVTTAGDGSTITVLTRSVNYDTPTNINDSGLVPVIAGTVNAGTGWLNTSVVVTVGTTPIVYVQFGQTAGIISPVNGGSGVSNSALSTVTINGAFPITWNLTASTDLTLPVSGTLATVGDIDTLAVLLAPTGDQTLTGGFSLILDGGNIQAAAGNLIAGADGALGHVFIHGATSGMGYLEISATDNQGNFNNLLTNFSTSAARTWELPDQSGTIAMVGDISSMAVLLNPGADQTILAHNLILETGELHVGTAAGGGAQIIDIFAPTANMGIFQLLSADNAGNFIARLTHASLSAARTWTLPDASGTLALTSGIPSLGDFTFTGDVMSVATTNANLSIEANGSGVVLVNSATPAIAGTTFQVIGTVGSSGRSGVASYNNNTNFANFDGYKSASATVGSHVAVSSTEPLLALNAWGDDGTNFVRAAMIRMLANGTVSTGVVPGEILMYTANAAGTLTQALSIDSQQQATFASQIFSPNGYITSGSAAGGFAGNFAMYSPTAGKGIFQLLCVDSTRAFNGILENAAMTASRTWVMPDASGTVALVSGSGSLVPVSVSGTSQALVAGSVYMFNNAAATTGTLPTSGSSVIGDVVKIKGRSAAPWIIQANTSQVITLGSGSSTAAGTATSAAGTDSMQLVYVASNEWSVDWDLSAGITLA